MSAATRRLVGSAMQGEARRARACCFAGAVAVGAALAAGELLAGLLPGVPSPLLAVARFIVDIQPPGAKDLVVALFGEADKLAFEIFIVLVALGIGAGAGPPCAQAAGRLPATVIAGFAAAGFAASPARARAASRPAGRGRGGGAGSRRDRASSGAWCAWPRGEGGHGCPRRPTARRGSRARPRSMPDWRRRSLLQAGGAIAVGSVFAGALGRVLLERQRTPPPPRRHPAGAATR